jgi:penicillin-binding protein 1A
MSDDSQSNITPLFPDDPEPGPERIHLKKLRLLVILVPLALLALVSTAFGMMMAVAAELPDLENRKEYQDARNSVLLDVRGESLGVLTNNQSRILVEFDDIDPVMRSAVIAIEDRRFYEHQGVDLRGIARALIQDVLQRRAAQGGSTIAQQFVKNALRASDDRTVFQKMREAALAYHLTRKWPKSKILTQYLNAVYFGNGAYGVEAAARTYFGSAHPGCGTRSRPCVKDLEPWEAALLAGIIASPSAYDPVAQPVAAKARRDLVLKRMLDQGRISRLDFFNGTRAALPADDDISPPTVRTKAPYFTTWVRQQLVDRYGARRALEGGMRVRTTLDLELQEAAESAVAQYLANPSGPSAALVAIDNDSGEVRAMVGGRDYNTAPFNLATQGQRQPGSAIKPFILAEALSRGISPGSLWPSRKREFPVPGTGGREVFAVNNFEDSYSGVNTLAGGLTVSDNAIFAAVGLHVGTRRVARMARRMGIRTPISTNYAMTLGGLREGVTPLDMAHAFGTFASGGQRLSGSLGSSERGPVGIRSVGVLERDGRLIAENEVRRDRVLSPAVADTARGILASVVQSGTGVRASLGGTTFAAGKTGTTEESGDAWFVGFTDRLTVAVWVGYPEGFKPMRTEFNGGPVEGGTFPALIWRAFMLQAESVLGAREDERRAKRGLPPETETTTPSTTTPVPSTPAAPAAPDAGGTDGGEEAAPETEAPAEPATPAPTPATPAPEEPAAPAPAPSTPAAPSPGGTGGTGAAAPPE